MTVSCTDIHAVEAKGNCAIHFTVQAKSKENFEEMILALEDR